MGTVTPLVVQKVLRRRMSPRGIEAMETLNSLYAAVRQLDFASSQWLDDSVKSLARLRVLVMLLAGEGQPVAHQKIINALQVKRATVSGLMAALERDGLIKSTGDTEDRRRQLATLTEKGTSRVDKAIGKNHEQLLKVVESFSKEELSMLRSLLDRLRDALAVNA
jgi:DNA-binding MarR family transcriptional regulator